VEARLHDGLDPLNRGVHLPVGVVER
jgi:hypothetical protein